MRRQSGAQALGKGRRFRKEGAEQAGSGKAMKALPGGGRGAHRAVRPPGSLPPALGDRGEVAVGLTGASGHRDRGNYRSPTGDFLVTAGRRKA